MKVLKAWGWVLFSMSFVLYGIGAFSGIFTRHVRYVVFLLYGESIEAILLLVSSVFCMLLAITIMFVVRAINSQKT